MQSDLTMRSLPYGITLLSEEMPGYHTATCMLRVKGGLISERNDQQGLAYVLEQAIDKGTANYDGKALADAFDAIGAQSAVYTGRQSWVFVVSSLPEHLPRAIELMGEIVTSPRFDQPIVETVVSLVQQELFSLQDSPRGLLRRQMAKQAYGARLGRHMLGNEESLKNIDANAVNTHWQNLLAKEHIAASVAGVYDDQAVQDALASWIDKLPEKAKIGVEKPSDEFSAKESLIQKDVEQTQIGISYRGVSYGRPEYATEKVMLGVLSGGMSSRLFTEVREKQGLVYWVGAWSEQPEGLGMLHIGAATKPERAEKTYETLLREVARLEEDLTEKELERAKVGLIADSATSGASVQTRASEMLVDYFHLNKILPAEEKREAIRSVTINDIKRYLENHPRDELSVVVVGPKALAKGGS